jgi:hypothetical protein
MTNNTTNRRREISKEYKERRQLGGVYTITNTVNGRYIIGHTADLAGIRNRFQFSVTTGSTVDHRLRADWQTLGGQAFRLDILEELEQQPDQSNADFMADLQALEQLLRANLDAAKAY